MNRVLLINMPFYTIQCPAIGLGLLKAGLAREGIPCDIRYLNLAFAQRLEREMPDIREPYDLIRRRFALFGDWIFARDLFEDGQKAADHGCEEFLEQYNAYLTVPLSRAALNDLAKMALRTQDQVRPFVDDCLHTIDWEDYSIVGFTLMFGQTVASLTLARRIKALYPHIKIVLGGASCEEKMGETLHRLFPYVDVVCSGEGDWVFPLLATRLSQRQPIEDIPNIVYRRGAHSCSTIGQPTRRIDPNDLPYPDYDDYFKQWDECRLTSSEWPRLLFEASRGCWWGEKSHCTFCSLNGTSMAYRSKAPERVLQEIIYLSERHGIRRLDAVDNILDMRYFDSLLPLLKSEGLGLHLAFETKSNLTKERVRLLHEAGVYRILPGIESLSTPILQLMRKGCTALQNIQLLKWAREVGLSVEWSLLIGFPGENPEEYKRMIEVIQAIPHLEPPWGCTFIRLDRFSPYFTSPDQYGIQGIRPLGVYRNIFPFDDADLSQLVYYFNYDFADGRNPRLYTQPVVDAVEEWKQNNYSSLTYGCEGDRLLIRDRRGRSQSVNILLRGAQAEVYRFCDQAHTFSAIDAHVRQICQQRHGDGRSSQHATKSRRSSRLQRSSAGVLQLGPLQGKEIDQHELKDFVQELVDLRVMLREGDRYLSLAVYQTPDKEPDQWTL